MVCCVLPCRMPCWPRAAATCSCPTCTSSAKATSCRTSTSWLVVFRAPRKYVIFIIRGGDGGLHVRSFPTFWHHHVEACCELCGGGAGRWAGGGARGLQWMLLVDGCGHLACLGAHTVNSLYMHKSAQRAAGVPDWPAPVFLGSHCHRVRSCVCQVQLPRDSSGVRVLHALAPLHGLFSSQSHVQQPLTPCGHPPCRTFALACRWRARCR